MGRVAGGEEFRRAKHSRDFHLTRFPGLCYTSQRSTQDSDLTDGATCGQRVGTPRR
jgi:hypothetical protein